MRFVLYILPHTPAIMKLVNLVPATLFLLAASQPLASLKTKSSDIWIGLDLNQCLTNASTILPPKYVPTKSTYPTTPTPFSPEPSHSFMTLLTSTAWWPSRKQLGRS